MKENSLDFSQIAMEIFEEQNKIRKNPQFYIEKLENNMQFFNNNIYRNPLEVPLETNEGVEGFKNAIEFLKNQQPLRELIFSEELTKAAYDHAKDMSSSGIFTHTGSEGEGISERVEKYIEWDGSLAENLDFCFKTPENIIINLLVDDGNNEKRQRENLFNDEFNYVGIAFDAHKTLKYCCVIVYAKGLHNIGEEPPDVINSVTDYINKTMPKSKEIQKNNVYQVDDIDAPDNTINVKINKFKKSINGKEKNIIRKTYVLDNGKQHIVEIEDLE